MSAERMEPKKKLMAIASVVVLVLAVAWIVFLLRPKTVVIEMPEDVKSAMQAHQADEEALRAMGAEGLKAEIAKREAAFRAADRGTDVEARASAEAALERAREVLKSMPK